MPVIAVIGSRFQSYNVEMVEVTGGRFWKPYASVKPSAAPDAQAAASVPAGMNPDLYEYRPPIALNNPRLRKLAAALAPAYVRVSGTWANTTYFQDTPGPAPASPPAGFNSVLTRDQWQGVLDFARAASTEIVTSFAISPGVRNAEGLWTPAQAGALLAYTKSDGGRIAAAEFMNEPNIALIGGAPRGYDAAAYARDLAVFRPFLKQTSPGTLLLGPGSVAESASTALPAGRGMIRTEDLLKEVGSVFDAFSYHLYPTVSQRCAALSPGAGTDAAAALTEDWLSRAAPGATFYTSLRDRFAPGKPLWITETAGASCGGNPWSSTFLDTFRYLDQLANLAQQGVQVVAHNTLAASDYALLDENTFAPRPNYWAALLWRRLMGTTVLKPNPPMPGGVHLYANCLKDNPGGVALLAINVSRTTPQVLSIPSPSRRYTLTAPTLETTRVDLNGAELKLGPADSLPQLDGTSQPPGAVTLPPASITFLAIPAAHNASCR
jgi:hypothetical protein